MLSSGGPYYVLEGEPVCLNCTVMHLDWRRNNSKSVIGWQKTQKETHSPTIIAFVTEFSTNHTALIYSYNFTEAHVSIVEDTVKVTFNSTYQSSGIYQCYYEQFPQYYLSNRTEVVVQGTAYK